MLARGDADAALTTAPLNFDGEFEFGGQEHFYLETHAVWAEAGEDGSVLVNSSTQHPSEIQAIVAEGKAACGPPQGRRPGPAHGRRLRRQGNARQCVRGADGAGVGEDRPAGAHPARSRPRHEADGQAAPFSCEVLRGPRPRRHVAWGKGVTLVSDGGWSLDSVAGDPRPGAVPSGQRLLHPGGPAQRPGFRREDQRHFCIRRSVASAVRKA